MTGRDEIKEVAHEAAQETVKLTFRELGVDLNDPEQVNRLHDTLHWARDAYEGQKRFKENVGRAAIWAAVGTFVTFVAWQAIDALFKAKGGP